MGTDDSNHITPTPQIGGQAELSVLAASTSPTQISQCAAVSIVHSRRRRRWRGRNWRLGGALRHGGSIGRAAGILPAITGCKLASSRLRKRLPADLRVSPRRVLQRRAAPTACRAPYMLAQHVGRRIGTPSDHERHKRDSYAVTAAAAKPQRSVDGLEQLFVNLSWCIRRQC